MIPAINDKNKRLDVKTLDNKELSFSISNLVYQQEFKNLKLVPFYQVHDARYMLYWPYTTQEKLPALQAQMKQQEAAKQQLEAATIDMVYPGEQQPEADHQFKGEGTRTAFFREKHYRGGRGWFSYTLRNAGKAARNISFMYYGTEKDKEFEVYINEELVTTISLAGTDGAVFKNKLIEIPAALQAAEAITIKFKASSNSAIGAIYEVRLLK
jgi:hypothetical protein